VKKYLFLMAALSLAPPAVWADQQPLRIGLMPAVNSIPLIVADHLRYFEGLGVRVELTMFQDQLTRETALQTGRIDGTISDLINAVSARANGLDVRVVSGTEGVFTLLAAPGGAVRSLEDWKKKAKVRTGLVDQSIVNFLTEKMVRSAGADPASIELVSTLQVPVRMELLLSGRIDAACLPEPMASVAVKRGAVRLADSTALSSTPGVLLFTGRAVKERAAEIRAVLQACDRAAAELNRNGDAYRPVIAARGGFPPDVQGLFVLPRFRPSAPPPQEEVAEVQAWMKLHGMLAAPLAYREVVPVLD
jgi:NitT/TauT family transport system substrate-binding protein